jgi:hypothetical protein
MNICPCCKRKMPAPSVARGKSPEAKLEQDRAKALEAIALLEQFKPWYSDSAVTRQAVAVAVGDEIVRMRHALRDTRLLWSIYRRRDSGASYVLPDAKEQAIAA